MSSVTSVNVNLGPFPDRATAEAEMEKYYGRWHPCGYGTHLKLVENVDGTFSVTGWRSTSCD